MSKLTKVLLLTFVVIISSLSIHAGETDNKTFGSSTPTHKARLDRVYNPNRKRAPSRDFIECEYTGTGIMLYPANHSEVAEVIVMGGDEFTNISEVVSEENGYFVETGMLSGVYEIQYSSELGAVYSGWIEI